VPTHLIGNDAFQEVDIVGITACTKHNYLVKSTADLARIVKEAFYLRAPDVQARAGRHPQGCRQRPGGLQASRRSALAFLQSTYQPHRKQLREVARLIEDARRR